MSSFKGGTLIAFLARHLWRAWKTVERVALPGEVPSVATPVPERT